ncbi:MULTISPECIES: MarR family winged helix-turn-helix transcriptional regulator [Streptomycetaceae]|uniref:MarR regulatory protein n=1 Tax=Streptantibioticus cattleyicolor (strain ATCC 35852 / DSM 46488 / JCM 4925 / NBRC 14057 / NRRL 8057) TaxID=1003195 RepID=F8JQ69_STREN|nr:MULTISPECIES: MarR family transcriptional regulator [Streptomycetaceae]AEW95335.1 marR regulatory protein [Streptantibioticus cattleyicolor NRRL 8057 = DSM 46488]MYS59913.1 MarR family transcriptional regulator [Streptomyces sp. SID5468]CCB75680.1 MarR-family transcriptional regulator [Streptantibioticus cattleyicolor NRRL 8057 = DSM 46488]
MATQEQCAELVRHFSGLSAVSRGLGRALPPECPPASVAVLTLLARYGEMRTGRLSERLGVDMSVTSRHVAYLADRGWIDRHPDPQDKRSRLLRLTPLGEQALREASDRIAEALADFLRDWTDEDVSQLATLMARLRASFGDCRPRAAHPNASRTGG